MWSSSQIKDVLTTYAEGLGCNKFNLKDNYRVQRIDINKWYALKKEFTSNKSLTMKFDRLRIVDIDAEGFMSCSCGYVQRMLMPCRHICSVLDKSENYVPSLFHIRWYKLYSYYYTKSVNNEICSNTKEALENMLLCTRENSYCMSGKYKGIFIMNTPFMD